MRWARRALLCLMLSLSGHVSLQGAARAYDVVFPETLRAGFVLRRSDLPKHVRSRPLRFQLDAKGRPHVLIENTFLALQDREQGDVDAFAIAGVRTVDGFAWMRDGTLLIISGKRLGVVTTQGFEPILGLPAKGMKIEPAFTDQAYLFGGNKGSQQRNLYLFTREGTLLHLLRAPSAIGAVTGTGDRTYFSQGKSIYLLAMGEPLTLMYEADDDVTSLAVADPWGLFYSTRHGVGYVSEPRLGYVFVRWRGAEVRLHDETLYLLLPKQGILQCSPVSSFKQLAVSIEASLEHASSVDD